MFNVATFSTTHTLGSTWGMFECLVVIGSVKDTQAYNLMYTSPVKDSTSITPPPTSTTDSTNTTFPHQQAKASERANTESRQSIPHQVKSFKLSIASTLPRLTPPCRSHLNLNQSQTVPISTQSTDLRWTLTLNQPVPKLSPPDPTYTPVSYAEHSLGEEERRHRLTSTVSTKATQSSST